MYITIFLLIYFHLKKNSKLLLKKITHMSSYLIICISFCINLIGVHFVLMIRENFKI
jgi:hypothetical protein